MGWPFTRISVQIVLTLEALFWKITGSLVANSLRLTVRNAYERNKEPILFLPFFFFSYVLEAFWKLEITPATVVPCFSCRSCQFSTSCSRATGCCCCVNSVTSCFEADWEGSRGAVLAAVPSVHSSYTLMAQDMCTASVAERNRLAIAISDATVRLIAVSCVFFFWGC